MKSLVAGLCFFLFLLPPFGSLVGAGSALCDLPLIEVPAKQPANKVLAVLLTGDGGWAKLVQEVSARLAGRGISVVGWNSLKYFWTQRSPEGCAGDLNRIVRHYMNLWKKESVMLIGYSLGADVMPFMASRMEPDLLDKTTLIVLLGLSREANFEFHLSDYWLTKSVDKGHPTLPEVRKLAGKNILCLRGRDEKDSACPDISQKGAKIIVLSGGHHFDGNYSAVVDAIMAGVEYHE